MLTLHVADVGRAAVRLHAQQFLEIDVLPFACSFSAVFWWRPSARCERTLEIQTADAIRLYGGKAIWKEVGQRLLDDTCQQRTGSHDDDGCWPTFQT
jgi:hypothetical protein